MASAGKITIAEVCATLTIHSSVQNISLCFTTISTQVEEIVPLGAIPAEDVHVPCIYVDRVIMRTGHEKRIEVCGEGQLF